MNKNINIQKKKIIFILDKKITAYLCIKKHILYKFFIYLFFKFGKN